MTVLSDKYNTNLTKVKLVTIEMIDNRLFPSKNLLEHLRIPRRNL